MKKILAALLGGIWIVSLLYRAHLIDQYARTLPKEPQPHVGRTTILNNHGTVVFLTTEEDEKLTWLLIGGMACGICAGVLALELRNRG